MSIWLHREQREGRGGRKERGREGGRTIDGSQDTFATKNTDYRSPKRSKPPWPFHIHHFHCRHRPCKNLIMKATFTPLEPFSSSMTPLPPSLPPSLPHLAAKSLETAPV